MKLLICQLFFTILVINSVFAINPTFYMEDTVRNSDHQYPVQRKSITIGIPLTHFSPKSNNNGLEYYTGTINLGFEALFNYSISNTASLSTGLNYQYNKITYRYHDPSLKTITNEITIPLLITFNLFQNKMAAIQLSSGFYLGQYISIIQHKREPRSYKKSYAELFSADDFIGDIYFAIGKNTIHKKIPIGVDLFFRYRLKERTFVNFYVDRAFYGIKLKYEFNL